MKQLQAIWNGLSEMLAVVFSQPVSLPFTGFLLLMFLRCVRLVRAMLTQGR
jgi:hypothetical protein